MKNLKQEWSEVTKLKIFEISVIDKRTEEQEWITFEINIVKNSFVAQHVALNAKEESSKKIAFKSLALDKDFSLDENLDMLHEICCCAILESEFYILDWKNQ